MLQNILQVSMNLVISHTRRDSHECILTPAWAGATDLSFLTWQYVFFRTLKKMSRGNPFHKLFQSFIGLDVYKKK